jgi:hypothetical protein
MYGCDQPVKMLFNFSPYFVFIGLEEIIFVKINENGG